MSAITTHVLDTARGLPAAGIDILLEISREGDWQLLGTGATDADGRERGLLSEGTPLEAGDYRLTFDVAAYYEELETASFYPFVQIVFTVPAGAPGAHFHVPLLLSPFGYSTYRGS